MPINEIVRTAIKYGPTMLFAFIIVVSILFGLLRGYHKSKVMFFHSLIIGGIFAAIYLILMNTSFFDRFIVTGINLMFGENYLQEAMGVSIECKTFTEILIEYIPHQMNYGDAITIIFKDNGAYLAALVNLIYHLIFFVLFLVLYFIVKLIVSIIYLCIYREDKYSLKKNKEFTTYKSDFGYRRRTLRGGLIGLGRGLICSLLVFSILGGTLYSVTGGKGEGDFDEVTFGDEEVDKYLDLYKEINHYGSNGIFKVLNVVKDSKDVPLYLYVADLVFRGGFKDEDIETNVNLRNELSNLTSFSKDSVKLMLKYGGNDVKDIILGKITDDAEMMDIIVDVLKNQDFQLELYQLFDKFDTESYMLNFSLSLVDSIIANIDTLDAGIPQEQTELMKVLFKKGYKSKLIPYEKVMLDKEEKNKDLPKTELPYVKPSTLISKNDLNVILNLVIDGLDEQNIPQDELYAHVVNNIRQLSILATDEKDRLNPVLARLYAYIESTMLSDEVDNIENLSDEEVEEYHDIIYYQEVDWIGELNSLLDNVTSIKVLTDNLGETEDFMSGFKILFDPSDEHYEENKRAYTNIKTYVEDSKLVGKLLSSRYISSQIKTGLQDVMPNMYFKEDLVYENEYDKDGNLVNRGELSNFLNIFEFFAKEENQALFDEFFNGENINIETIQNLVNNLNSYDEKGVLYSEYVTESDLIRSLISSALIAYTDNMIYVPEVAKELDKKNNPVNVIKKEYMDDLFTKLNLIVELVNPLMNDPENPENIDRLLKDSRLDVCLNNPVIEATIANQIIINLDGKEGITLPLSLKTPDGWISTGEKGELNHIIDSITLLDINVVDIMNGNLDAMDMVNKVQSLSNYDVDRFFDSKVLLSTVTNLLLNNDNLADMKIIVPNSALNDDQTIDKADIVDLVNTLRIIPLDSFDNPDPSELLTTLIKNKEVLLKNDVIVATVVYNVKDKLPTELKLTPELEKDASLEALKKYTPNNVWRKELPALFNVMESFFMDDGVLDINNGLTNIENRIVRDFDEPSIVDSSKTNLDILCESKIILKNVTDIFDDMVVTVVSNDVTPSWKDRNGYFKDNEIKAILGLVKSLGVSSFDSINFDNINFNSNETINAVNESSLIRAVITNQIEPLFDNGTLVKNNKAFDSNNILNADEILSFVKLLDGNNLNSFNINNINISLFKNLLYDKGKTKSYILVSTTSKYITQTEGLVIPKRVYSNNTITAQELNKLIHSIEILLNKEGNLTVGDVNLNNIKLPSNPEVAKDLIASDIVNATIVKNLVFAGSNLVLGKSPRNSYNKDINIHKNKGFEISNIKDIYGNSIVLFTPGEFESLILAINNIGELKGNLEFTLNAKKIKDLLNDDQKCDAVLSSTFVHLFISDILNDAISMFESTFPIIIPKGPNEPYRTEAYDIKTLQRKSITLYSCDFIKETLRKFDGIIEFL